MEPNEQSSPPEDFYQQQLQFADRVFFGSIDPSAPQSIPITRPLIYGTGGEIPQSGLATIFTHPEYTIGQVLTVTDGALGWTSSSSKVVFEEMGDYQEDQIPSKSLFARIKIQKEKRKRKK